MIQCAEHGGWYWYHNRKQVYGPSGWPDLVMLRPPEMVAVELKAKGGT